MFFILKKLLTACFYPLTILLILQIISVVLLWVKKNQNLAKIFLSAGLLFHIFIVYGIFDPFIFSYERMYSPLKNTNEIKKNAMIVVLGGGVFPDRSMPLTERFSTSTLRRLLEGIRLYSAFENSGIIFSGGKILNSDSEAGLMKEYAVMAGVPESSIVLEDQSVDTEDQAVKIRPIVGETPFILVTSAFHMPRSVALFEQHGMHPIPAPSDYMLSQRSYWHPSDIFPDSLSYNRLDRIIKEYLGLLWLKIRRK